MKQRKQKAKRFLFIVSALNSVMDLANEATQARDEAGERERERRTTFGRTILAGLDLWFAVAVCCCSFARSFVLHALSSACLLGFCLCVCVCVC